METTISFQTPETELTAYFNESHEYENELGSLDVFFRDRVAKYTYPLSFLQQKFSCVNAWRKEALNAFEDAMHRPHEATIISAIQRDFVCNDLFTREEWILQTSIGQKIPATVLKPRREQVKYPAVIALHDMSGMRIFGREKMLQVPDEPLYLSEARRMSYEGTPLAEALVQRGYLVIAIDALGFGERVVDWNLPCGDFLAQRMKFSSEQARVTTRQIIEKEYSAMRGTFLTGTTWAGMIAQDDLLTLDFLCSREDVDTERIGCIGFSFGAYRTHYLAAIDTRIKAAVSVCWQSTLAGIAGFNIGGAMGAFTLLPGLHDKMDLCDIVALACPRSLLAISAYHDRHMQPSGAVQAHLNLRKIWEKAGASGRFGSLFYEGGHRCDRTMQQAAFNWFEQELVDSEISMP